ncbi:MAG: HaeII family restriction endonuclease [Planctomycetota bacterium]|jgi:hypothetical protein
MPKHTAQLTEAKQQLDRLVANARDQLLMPITIAEVLRRIADKTADINDIDAIRKNSYHWCATICRRLFGKKLSLNRSYWGRLYSHHVPPTSLATLAEHNGDTNGVAEAYVYARLRQTTISLQAIRKSINEIPRSEFILAEFLSAFESDEKLKRSIDKAYEVVVHALFNAIAGRVKAQVTVSVSTADAAILEDFKDFCKLLLGVDAETPTMTVPARLYRVGGANSRDGGVDLWANFGPAIQVKHVSLDAAIAPPIVESVSAEHMVIVCLDADKQVIEVVLKQLGLDSKVRGIITKADLQRWYGLALGPKHLDDMAAPLFKALLTEFDDEFPLANPAAIDALVKERGYDALTLDGDWSVAEPVVRAPNSKKKPTSKENPAKPKETGTASPEQSAVAQARPRRRP